MFANNPFKDFTDSHIKQILKKEKIFILDQR